MEYNGLAEAVVQALVPHFRIAITDADALAMMSAASKYSKGNVASVHSSDPTVAAAEVASYEATLLSVGDAEFAIGAQYLEPFFQASLAVTRIQAARETGDFCRHWSALQDLLREVDGGLASTVSDSSSISKHAHTEPPASCLSLARQVEL